jgi:hypothetical protein
MRFLPQFDLSHLDWIAWLVVQERFLFVDDGLDDLGRPIL